LGENGQFQHQTQYEFYPISQGDRKEKQAQQRIRECKERAKEAQERARK